MVYDVAVVLDKSRRKPTQHRRQVNAVFILILNYALTTVPLE